jgi:putative acetyltransferase
MVPEPAQSRTVQLLEVGPNLSAARLAQARELVLEYGRFVAAGAAGFCFGSLTQEAERLPFSYLEQGGGSLLATVDAEPGGFVAWRAIPPSPVVTPNAWEMKRLWVLPAARGTGLGRTLTMAVLDRAVAAGKKAIYLDTVPAVMLAAYRLYLELGFQPCAPYNDNPVEELARLVKFLSS